ncbi:oxidoreductase [Arthrobacter burdickii]|uniref:Oxidoreductase n=1 Tax=Arthrobacter burdickii TaxID=3035920 RepID=A0ABT8K2D1_9MICC|nr:oxidoreductase [Arthrobacter burdickii]MDN4611591.1 oxidoreductase [Arthrobacter burdickii]
MTTWLITGCSTGLGRALAEAVLQRGHRAVVTARDASTVEDLASEYPDTALALPLDVTDASQVRTAIERGTAAFGGIDVLVNNAGYGYRAAVEEGDDDDVRTLFDTHFFGSVDMIKAVLPQMRARRSGTIVNLSSIGAKITPAGSGYYAAVKAAIEGLTGSLRKEVEPLGITAMVVEPGGFRTDFSGRSLQQSVDAIEDYSETAGKRRKENDTTHGTQPGDPAKAAAAIITAVESPDTPEVLVLGSDAISAHTGVLRAQLESLEAWRPLGESTGVDA